jgi:hypothetical protein
MTKVRTRSSAERMSDRDVVSLLMIGGLWMVGDGGFFLKD